MHRPVANAAAMCNARGAYLLRQAGLVPKAVLVNLPGSSRGLCRAEEAAGRGLHA